MRQWVLFQQLRYYSLHFYCFVFSFVFFTSHFHKVWENEERRCTQFPTEGKCLGIATGCCWCSAVAEHRDLTAKLRPNVGSRCLNKTHCFSLPAKKLLMSTIVDCSFFCGFFCCCCCFKNIGLVLSCPGCLCLGRYCHSSWEALAIQRSSGAAKLSRVKPTGS